MSSLIVDFPNKPIRHESGMPGINNRTFKKKLPSVRFSPTSALYAYREPPRDPADGASPWYSSEDEEAFKFRTREEIRTLLKIKESGCELDQMGALFSELSPVGLEQHLISRDFARKRLITRRLVTLAVLNEQARRGASDDVDKQERIARVSMRHSKWSIAQAETIGSFQAMSNRNASD